MQNVQSIIVLRITEFKYFSYHFIFLDALEDISTAIRKMKISTFPDKDVNIKKDIKRTLKHYVIFLQLTHHPIMRNKNYLIGNYGLIIDE